MKRGVYILEPKAEEAYWSNYKLKRTCTIWLAALFAVTVLFQAFGSAKLWNAHNLARGTTFDDYESFMEYMAQEIPYEQDRYPVAPDAYEQIEPDRYSTWYDEDGNEITREEAHTCTLKDAKGQVVCTYLHYNRSVASIRYDPKEGTVLPITAISHTELENAWRLHDLITAGYCLLYAAEAAAVLLIYFRKRAK